MLRMFKVTGISICLYAAAVFSLPAADAQDYPTKPIRMLVGLGVGGAADTTARLVAQKLSADLGQNVVVDNRPGASGVIAYERVATSTPDGYTIGMVTAAVTTLPYLQKQLPYDIQRDLQPVALASTTSHVFLVHPAVKANSISELIALARSQPGKLSYASTGIGSAQHMAGEYFNYLAKTNIVHVPYKGGAESVRATLAGQVEITFGSVVAVGGFISSGKLRGLGITGTKRSPLLPNVPTIGEAGLPGYESIAWYGVVAPTAVPKSIVAKLNELIVKSTQTAEVRDAFNKLGLEPQSHTPQQFGELIRSELAKNKKIVELAGIQSN